MKRIGSLPSRLIAQAPRMIGAISDACAVVLASFRAENTTGRPWRRRLSASDTISIMRS
jgi:hypothetical protein